MKLFKNIICFALLLSTTLGFRLRDISKSWEVSPADAYLWIRPCDRNTIIQDNNVNSGDPLFGLTNVTIEQALQTVIDDVNLIYGSFLRLEMYPVDPTSPPMGSQFNATSALTRTIDVCPGAQQGIGGGNSEPEFSGNTFIGCRALYVESERDNMRSFLWIAQHEIGHCLKLEHPQDLTDAVMSYYSDKDEIYRYAKDDQNGIKFLYPADGFNLKESSTGGLSCSQRN